MRIYMIVSNSTKIELIDFVMQRILNREVYQTRKSTFSSKRMFVQNCEISA